MWDRQGLEKGQETEDKRLPHTAQELFPSTLWALGAFSKAEERRLAYIYIRIIVKIK